MFCFTLKAQGLQYLCVCVSDELSEGPTPDILVYKISRFQVVLPPDFTDLGALRNSLPHLISVFSLP